MKDFLKVQDEINGKTAAELSYQNFIQVSLEIRNRFMHEIIDVDSIFNMLTSRLEWELQMDLDEKF